MIIYIAYCGHGSILNIKNYKIKLCVQTKRYEHANFIRFYHILKGVGVTKTDITEKLNGQKCPSFNIIA